MKMRQALKELKDYKANINTTAAVAKSMLFLPASFDFVTTLLDSTSSPFRGVKRNSKGGGGETGGRILKKYIYF